VTSSTGEDGRRTAEQGLNGCSAPISVVPVHLSLARERTLAALRQTRTGLRSARSASRHALRCST